MKCKVSLFKAGTIFEEIVQATDYEDAKEVALARNPNATVMGVTAVFE
jgi:hypothetical protein